MTNLKKYEIFFTASIKETLLEEEIEKNVRPLYITEGFKRIYQASYEKKMLPFVASMMIRVRMDTDQWQPIYDMYRKRNTLVKSQLNVVYEAMSKAGVKRIFVSENYGALLASGRDLGLFASGDLDSCADLLEKQKIDEVFEKLGYKKRDRYSGYSICTTSYHNDDVLPDGFYFGVSWEPLSRVKLPCFIDTNDFVDWDNLQNVEGTQIKLPSIEALLYICLMHITLHSFHRAPAIRLYADILNTCLCQNVNWERVFEWALRDKTVIRMMTSAILAHKLADVEIPDFVKAYENNRRVKRLLSLVYDSKNNCLKPEPGKLSVYAIEIACNDRNDLQGFLSILYPGAYWLKNHYGHGASLSTLLHLKNLL